MQDKISIATGASAKSRQWKNMLITWQDLINKLNTPVRTTETVKEWTKLSKEDRSAVKDVGGFVGGYLLDGRRKPEKVLHRQLLCLDIDYAESGLESDIALLCCAAVLHSSHSHTVTEPRFRLILPLSRAVTAEEYTAIAKGVAYGLGIDQFDPSTFQSFRLMFWPSCSKDADYYFKEFKGPWLDADAQLAASPEACTTTKAHKELIDTELKRQEDPTTKKGLVGAFCRTYSISAVIESFLSDTYTPCGSGRYTYTRGTSAAGLVVYEDKWAYSHHGTDPVAAKLCNAFDIVRLHKFGHLADKESFKAMEAFACTDADVKRLLAEENRAKLVEEFGIDAANTVDDSWMEQLEVDRRGHYLSSISNINLIFAKDPRLAKAFAYNIFACRPCVIRSLPWRDVDKIEHLRNVDFAGLRNYIETAYGIAAPSRIEDALTLELERNKFHPVRDYLRALKWDGIKRVDTLLVEYLNATDTIYTREAIRKTLVGAVARVEDPGVKFDTMLVLVGEQGCGKSTLVRKLGRQWFSDSFTTVHNKESFEQLQGAWIMEVAELSGFRRAEVESVKHFIAKQIDTFRPPYGRLSEDFPRQCVFIGTTNKDTFLNDVSGNRRFIPVDVAKGKKSVMDLDDSEIAQIWAEAYVMYQTGEKLYMSPEASAIAATEQEAHREVDERTGLIENYLDRLLPSNWAEMDTFTRRSFIESTQKGTERRSFVCVAEIWCECLGKNREDMDRYKTREINDILRSLPSWSSSRSTKNFKNYGKQKYYARE